MIKEDLIAERIAIDSGREMIDYIGDSDSTTKRRLEGILAMEEEHADDLVGMLEELGKMAVQRRPAGSLAQGSGRSNRGVNQR